jgi:hypothetical protein
MHRESLHFDKLLLVILTLAITAILPGGANAAPPAEWLSRGPGGGGALFAPSFSPHNPNEIYISCDMSELFRSTNLGQSWSMLSFRQIQGNRGSQVRFTNDPLIVYTLDYTNIAGADLVTPSKSTDGGATWQRMSADPTGGEAYSLYVDPNNANNLIVSNYSNIYFSSNGGTSFQQKFTNAAGCYVAGAFFDGANIFVGTSAGLVFSINGGTTFTTAAATGIPASQSMVSFAGAKQNGTTRLFCVTLSSGDVFPGLLAESSYAGYQSIYSLDWGQPSWVAKVTGIAASHYPFFVSMALGNTSTAYVAGQTSDELPIIYKTTNGGGNWQNTFSTTNNQNIHTGWAGHGGDRGWTYGAGALGFAVAPTDVNKAAFTDLGFAHMTTDGGATWKQMYVNPADQNTSGAATPKGRSYRGIGLEDTTCWWITWSDATNMFASYSDIRGTRSTDAGQSWSFNYTGQTYNSTYQSLKHPVSGNLYAAVSSVHDMYQSTYLQDSRINVGTGEIKYSTNAGASWLVLHDFGRPVIGLAVDPTNPNRMYASVIHSTTGGIFVSNNIQNGAASVWTKVAVNPPRTEGHPFNIKVLSDGTLVCTYSGRRNSSGTFTASSGVFVSTDGGNSWADRSHTGMMYWTKDIVIDPHDSTQNTWYVCVWSGWGGPPNGLGGLYKTMNRGASWTRINSLDRVTSCAISPVNADEMYLTTETEGLWYSSNLNAANPDFIPVDSYPFRQPERVFYNPHNQGEVWVTSFGHGLRVGSSCSYSISPANKSFSETGGEGSFQVSAASSCDWSAASNQSWIVITSRTSGAGSNVITYAVRDNLTGAARQGAVVVAGQTFTIVQKGGVTDCAVTLSPTFNTFSASGGTSSIQVTAGSNCAWQAVSHSSWIIVTSNAVGMASGTVTYSVAPNATGSSRKGKIMIKGQTYSVKQKGS